MALTLTQFDGNTINGATSYRVYLPYGSATGRMSRTVMQDRRNASPQLSHVTTDALRFVIRISAANTSTAYATFQTNVQQWFAESRSGTTRELRATWHDGSTAVKLDVLVERLTKIQDAGSVGSLMYEATLVAPYPYWEAVTATTSAAGPANVTNNGNVPALPSLALTTTTHVTRRACTVSGTGAAGGLIAYPVRFDLDDANATSTNVFVYVEGVSVPCLVLGSGGAASSVWALIDTAADGSDTDVDIIYGTGLTNPLAGTLAFAGMDLDDRTNCTNAQWEWDNWLVTSHPARCGAWRPGLTGKHHATANASYAITSDATGSVVISIGAPGEFDNSADSIILVVGAQAGTSSALASLSRVTANLDGTNARAYVRYRVAGSSRWQDTAYLQTANATVTTSVDLDNAVEIAVGIENHGTTPDPATLTISGTAVRLTLANTPTVTVGAATNMDFYDGAYRIGGSDDPEITLVDFVAPDGSLVIDAKSRSITSSAAGPFYGSVEFTDPDEWLRIDVGGAQTVSDTTGGSDVITHRNTYG